MMWSRKTLLSAGLVLALLVLGVLIADHVAKVRILAATLGGLALAGLGLIHARARRERVSALAVGCNLIGLLFLNSSSQHESHAMIAMTLAIVSFLLICVSLVVPNSSAGAKAGRAA